MLFEHLKPEKKRLNTNNCDLARDPSKRPSSFAAANEEPPCVNNENMTHPTEGRGMKNQSTSGRVNEGFRFAPWITMNQTEHEHTRRMALSASIFSRCIKSGYVQPIQSPRFTECRKRCVGCTGDFYELCAWIEIWTLSFSAVNQFFFITLSHLWVMSFLAFAFCMTDWFSKWISGSSPLY